MWDALSYSSGDSAWGQCVQAGRSCKNGVGVCSGLYGTHLPNAVDCKLFRLSRPHQYGCELYVSRLTGHGAQVAPQNEYLRVRKNKLTQKAHALHQTLHSLLPAQSCMAYWWPSSKISEFLSLSPRHEALYGETDVDGDAGMPLRLPAALVGLRPRHTRGMRAREHLHLIPPTCRQQLVLTTLRAPKLLCRTSPHCSPWTPFPRPW